VTETKAERVERELEEARQRAAADAARSTDAPPSGEAPDLKNDGV
jgi:hypothetical protein